MMDQRKTSGAYEETRVYSCTALGVAGRGAITATAAGCRRPDEHIATPQYRCYLRRGNHRDVLQCTHQPETWWLRIEQRVGVERRSRSSHAVHSALLGIPAGQRTVQLIRCCGRASMVGASNCSIYSARDLRFDSQVSLTKPKSCDD